MLQKIKKLIPFAVSTLLMAAPQAAFAQTALVPVQLSATSNIILAVNAIIRFILIIAFVLAFIMLIIGGIRWILAGGDEKAVEKARGTITAALIGLVIVLLAFAIIRVVEVFFGVSIITGGVSVPTI